MRTSQSADLLLSLSVRMIAMRFVEASELHSEYKSLSEAIETEATQIMADSQ
jgi:hypothetical protein